MKVEAKDVHSTLDKAMLVEGYPVVLDVERSHGSWIYDARGDRELLDFFTFYASRPVAFNHPRLREPDYLEKLLLAARCKPSNGDVYTTLYAEFVETFRSLALGPGMKHLFFVDGGALAVENALKAAFDWKARKNLANGRPEGPLSVLHFQHAFHGRSGYTMSLTNTSDPRKTQYFPKFDWPRVSSPAVDFPIDVQAAEQAERATLAEIDAAFEARGPGSIACILIEPIQGEGGDRHFRPEFMSALRAICDQREALLVFDEVQTGLGMTGTMWCYEQLGVVPDVVAFAKKAQTGGIMAGARLDEVESVFQVQSRISSTFGGNLVDFVRCTQYLEIMAEDRLIENAKARASQLLQALHTMVERFDVITNARGRGLMLAIDLPDGATRDRMVEEAMTQGLMVLPCGDFSLRLRPALDVTEEECDLAIGRLNRSAEICLGN